MESENSMTYRSREEESLLWNYHSKHGLFRKEGYYFGLICLICAAIVFYCKSEFYLFGLDQILAIGKALSKFYLGMSTIMDGAYDVKTKEFYSLFYLFFPIYFFVGIFASFFISPYRYRVLIVGVSSIKMLFFLVLTWFFAIFPALAPMVGFDSPTWLTLFNAIMMAGIVYAAGRVLIAAITKFKLARDRT